MYTLIISLCYRFHHGFAHGGVGVHAFDYLVACGFQVARNNRFDNHIGNAFANHVATQPFAVFLVKNVRLHWLFRWR